MKTIQAIILSIDTVGGEWWYKGCGVFDPDKNRYCRKSMPNDGVIQNEDDVVRHEGECRGNMCFWQCGLMLGDATGQMNVRIWNSAAYLFGRNGIPIFANDIAKLSNQECLVSIMNGVVGDERVFDVEMSVSTASPYEPIFDIKFVHLYRVGHNIPLNTDVHKLGLVGLSIAEPQDEVITKAISALLAALEQVDNGNLKLPSRAN